MPANLRSAARDQRTLRDFLIRDRKLRPSSALTVDGNGRWSWTRNSKRKKRLKRRKKMAQMSQMKSRKRRKCLISLHKNNCRRSWDRRGGPCDKSTCWKFNHYSATWTKARRLCTYQRAFWRMRFSCQWMRISASALANTHMVQEANGWWVRIKIEKINIKYQLDPRILNLTSITIQLSLKTFT